MDARSDNSQRPAKHALDSLSRLPTFEEATGSNDVSRLPSYSESRGARYHPYSRRNKARDNVSRLFHTVFDDEYVALDVPPARPGPRPTVAPLVPTLLPNNEEAQQQALERRMQRISAVILCQFIAGLTRATTQG